MEMNETKLANAVSAKDLRPAREEEIRAVGAQPGYASPVGLKNVFVVIDEAAAQSPNLVAGANEEGYHLRNVNFGRDFSADLVTDIAAAGEGDACLVCGSPLRAVRGVEVGNIFKLGTRYTEALGATFLDQAGVSHPVIMGSYGIGIGRLLACIAEEHHDDRGLKWPVSIAPYHVYLVTLGDAGTESRRQADALYQSLQHEDIEVLYDDRDERPGVKFNDADLIGLPLRVTVSDRSLAAGGVEFKYRGAKETTIVPIADVAATIESALAAMRDGLRQLVVGMPFED
jgi:prolyl-tRNA synthetase